MKKTTPGKIKRRKTPTIVYLLQTQDFFSYIAKAATKCDRYCCFTVVDEVSWSCSSLAKLMLLLVSAAEPDIYMDK